MTLHKLVLIRFGCIWLNRFCCCVSLYVIRGYISAILSIWEFLLGRNTPNFIFGIINKKYVTMFLQFCMWIFHRKRCLTVCVFFKLLLFNDHWNSKLNLKKFTILCKFCCVRLIMQKSHEAQPSSLTSKSSKNYSKLTSLTFFLHCYFSFFFPLEESLPSAREYLHYFRKIIYPSDLNRSNRLLINLMAFWCAR